MENCNQERRLPFIETKRTTMRLPAETDVAAILSYFQENEQHFAATSPKRAADFYTEKSCLERIENCVAAYMADKSAFLYVFDRSDDRGVIGTVEFSQISRGPFQACYLGYGVSRRWEGKGFMFEAVGAGIQFAFRDLNLHRIMANHLPANARSARLLACLGFTVECTARNYLRIDGEWRDHVLNSLTNDDWRPL